MTVGRFVGIFFAGLGIVLAILLSIFYQGSRSTILLASRQIMRQASQRVTERTEGHLEQAERLLQSFERQVDLGIVDTAKVESVRTSLISELESHPRVTEVTLTYGRVVGTYQAADGPHDAGDLRLAPGESGQVSVARVGAENDVGVLVRRAWQQGDRWLAEENRLPYEPSPHPASPPAIDPTTHATFSVPTRHEYKGRALWSDLSYIEADAGLPEPLRRRVVSVQKALWSTEGTLLGVLRVSLLNNRIDEFTKVGMDKDAPGGEQAIVFICDRFGRLITRLGHDDRFALLATDGTPDPNGDVRVVPASPPPAVIAALRSPMLAKLPLGGSVIERYEVARVPHLMSVASLLEERTQGWLVGIVVPESFYLEGLEASRRRVLAIAALLVVVSVLGGAIALRAVRNDLGGLVAEVTRLSGFDFARSARRPSTFHDVAEAAESLEQAKTALRALGKYAPLDLVRELYEARLEPMLGGRIQEVTLLFSDIAGFTSVSEGLSPDRLAVALGAYLEVVTSAIHATGGIIDKYTGDGVMAMWNAPRPLDRHAERACEAALACREATERLFASPPWQGLAPWATRFGIHRGEASVGHFGAPDRMSFTAMGDSVNLASRLESLNKQYGTSILVSGSVETEARDRFLFRRLDRVAVKGRREGVEIFELIDRRDERRAAVADRAVVERYERALEAYQMRRFAEALELLRASDDDPPSRVLAARCEHFLSEPPASDWTGIWIAREK
jgi:adenylate cyclase